MIKQGSSDPVLLRHSETWGTNVCLCLLLQRKQPSEQTQLTADWPSVSSNSCFDLVFPGHTAAT